MVRVECGSEDANGGLSSIYLLSFPLINIFTYIYLFIHISIYSSIYINQGIDTANDIEYGSDGGIVNGALSSFKNPPKTEPLPSFR